MCSPEVFFFFFVLILQKSAKKQIQIRTEIHRCQSELKLPVLLRGLDTIHYT